MQGTFRVENRERVHTTTIKSPTGRMPFVAAGAVTGIGSLPLTSVTSAVRAVAEFSPEVPFWPQLPQLSQQESIVGQGLAIVEDLIEPRNEGYGYRCRRALAQGRVVKSLVGPAWPHAG